MLRFVKDIILFYFIEIAGENTDFAVKDEMNALKGITLLKNDFLWLA